MSHQEVFCNDYGDAPDCAKTPDPRYTMSFEDIGQGCIYWCSVCGPKAQAMDTMITNALEERGEPFITDLTKAVDEAYKGVVKS